MTKLIIWGAGGKMGQVLTRMCQNDNKTEFVCGVDKFCSPKDFNYKIYNDEKKITETCDVIIDFSRPEALDDIIEFAKNKKCGVVLATTGYDDNQLKKIEKASKTIPIFMSYNMSLGVNLLCDLAQKAGKILADKFDIEIIEKHHNQKVDAPSGTAIMLANSINDGLESKKELVYGRHGTNCKRQDEIGMHAIRGGTIVGQHDVIFAGLNEIVTLSHQAESKEVFASGAIEASKFLNKKPAKMYSMKDIFN